MNSKAMVSHNGNVFWPPPTKFRSTCPVDVTYFPFDDQTCIMKLGSWTYDGFQVAVRRAFRILKAFFYLKLSDFIAVFYCALDTKKKKIKKQVDVTNRTTEVDLTNYVPNGEWELLEARLIRNVAYYSCCPEVLFLCL